MRFIRVVALAVPAVVACRAEMNVRFIVAPEVVVADSAPDVHFRADAAVMTEFRSRLEAYYPGQTIRLGPDRMLSADERALIIVPTITVARVAHDVRAGSIHRYEAVVVAD